MKLSIRIQNGSQQGRIIPIRSGMTLGRSKAEFKLSDPKASSLHAEIIEVAGQRGRQFYLKDNNSKNGCKINGLRVNYFELTPGLIFTIGSTAFEVQKQATKTAYINPERKENQLNSSPPSPRAPQIKPDIKFRQPPPPPVIEIEPQVEEAAPAEPIPWNEVLESFSQSTLKKLKNLPKEIMPLNPALSLNFIRGVQADTSWTLGYGPRKIGSDGFELIIYEPEAPGECFEIIPTKEGALFKTPHPDQVLLNDKACSSEVLKENDIISINNTLIKVGLIP